MNDDLHTQLDAQAAQIDKTRSEAKAKEAWHDGHHLTAGELEARYAYPKGELDREVADADAHGRHVSNLEYSVRQWIDGRDL
tara:strand:+ start:456 stop:701 length:246 start_codon:yes stop_codon:yes gene_type:complete